MKTKRFGILAILFLASVSCNDNKIETPTGITGLTEEVYFEQVGDVNSIGLTEHYELLIQQATANNAEENASLLKHLEKELDAAEEYQQECINQSGANSDVGVDGSGGKNRLLGYQYSTIRYKSIDYNGNPAMLSTLVVWPFNNLVADDDAQNVVIGCHVTYGSNSERPTNYSKNSIMSDVGMLACCAKSSAGIDTQYHNLVIIPDYQGFGATHGDVHPYLSQEITARQVLDGVRAGIAYYQQTHKLNKDWKSVSTGYSQGGSVAMAVHKYIEQNNLVDEFNFAGSVCGSGPYDPVATLQKYISTNYVYMPVAAAMMMYSMCHTNPRLKGKYKIEDFISKKFLDSGVITMIEEKKLITDEMQEQLLQYSGSYNMADEDKFLMHRLSKDDYRYYPYRKDTKDSHNWSAGYIRTARTETCDLLDEKTYLYFKENGKPSVSGDYTAVQGLWDALEDNVLYRDWTPSHPIFLYHTEEDEVVVVENFQNCLKAWEGSNMVKGTIYKGLTETHVSYGSCFYLFHCGEGISAIFDGRTDDYEFSRIDRAIF